MGFPELGAGLGAKVSLGLATLGLKGLMSLIGGTMELRGNQNAVVERDKFAYNMWLETDGEFDEYNYSQANEILPPVDYRLKNSHGFVFGAQNGATIARGETEDGHIMVVGGSGSGKSSCIAIPTLLSWNKRVFAIDVKAELYGKTKHIRQNIKWFCPLDSGTFGYDPYHAMRKNRNKAQEAETIAHAIIPKPPNIKEPFWIDSARDLLTGTILHCYSEGHSFIETIKHLLSTPIDRL